MAVIELNTGNFENEVTNSDIPVVVDFWAPWCGPCKMMHPVFEQISEEYENKIKFARLNTDKHPHIANQFEIRGIPTFLALKKGNIIGKMVGYMPKATMKSKIDEFL